jgi:transcriptional regulator with XRE-family HTH domain
MEIKNNDIGARIKRIRTELKMTQVDLSKVLKLGSNKAVSFYETGTSAPSLASLIKIAEIGKRSLDWLITGLEPVQLRAQKAEVNFPLGEDEKLAVHTAENLLERYGLEKRFAVVEIHHPPSQEEMLNDDEKELLEAFRLVDQASKTMLLQVANNAALAFRQGGGRNRPEENSSPAANCA